MTSLLRSATLEPTPEPSTRAPESGDQAPRKRPGPSWRPLIVAALFLLLAELSVRAVSPPNALVWPSDETQVKVEELEALGRDGGVDTVFVGSSVVDVALQPARFAERAGVDGAYNAAVLGTELRSIELWVREVVAPATTPNRVVIGLSCREINASEAELDTIYDGMRTSPGMRERLGTEPVLQRVESAVADWSELVRYRSVLRKPRSLLGRDRHTGVNLALTDGGYNAAYADRAYPPPERLQEVLVPGDITRFRPDPEQLAALDRTLDHLEGAGIEAVVVHMATTEDWLDYLPPGGIDTCRGAIEEHAVAGGARYVELGVLDRSLFADPIHVNGAGSDVVTDAIADALSRGEGS